MDYTGKYFGAYKILGIAKEDVTTPSGNEIVKVLLENSLPILATIKTLDIVVTDEPSDATVVQNKKFDVMIPEIMKVIAEYDLYAFETESLVRRIIQSFSNSLDRATNYLWTKDDKAWIQNADSTMVRSLLEVDKLLKTIPSDEGKSEDTTE